MRLLPHFAIFAAFCCSPLLFAQDDSDNSNGNGADDTIHAVTVLHEDGTKTVTITDPDKHSSEASTYDGGNNLMERIVYALDDNNQPVSGVVYTAKNQPVFKSTYKRDDMNRISEEDDYTMDDQLIRRFVYEFGPNGNVVRIRCYDAQGNEIQASVAKKDERQSLPRVH